MTEATVIVLKMDLKHLTQAELDWLHELNNRLQVRQNQKTRKGAA